MLFTILLAAAALHALPQAIPLPQKAPLPLGTSEATAEGTEILRRILAETLDEAFADKQSGDKVTMQKRGIRMHSLVTTLWVGDQTVQHSRAFHLPDAGLFFALDASLPVVAQEPGPEPAQSDQPTDDEWERYRREVRGHLSPDGTLFRRLNLGTPRAAEIDPAAIEKVIDTVLRTVVRHAFRVEGLTPRETITVALRLSGKNRTLLQDFSPENGEFQLGFEAGEMPEEGESQSLSAYVLASGHEVREQNLVIRIAVSELASLSEGGIERLRQRAQINRYKN
ncbi:MAG: hypothetical protein HOP15_07580 [Planctomycetes bacterium]|nr:hypothetical protein [Planctomycetota bacterium]